MTEPSSSARGSEGQGAYEPVVVRNYFARWRLHSTKRWTAVHWFRDALPACGLPEPDGPYDFDLPPEPIITCKRCQRLNREAMADA